MKISDLGRKLERERAVIDAAKKKAKRNKRSASKPIKKKPTKIASQTSWVGDPLDDPIPF